MPALCWRRTHALPSTALPRPQYTSPVPTLPPLHRRVDRDDMFVEAKVTDHRPRIAAVIDSSCRDLLGERMEREVVFYGNSLLLCCNSTCPTFNLTARTVTHRTGSKCRVTFFSSQHCHNTTARPEQPDLTNHTPRKCTEARLALR